MTANIDRAASADVAPRRPSKARGRTSQSKHPLRSLGVFAAVFGLVATIAVPAFSPAAPVAPATATTTLQQIAKEEAQSLVVVSELAVTDNERGTFLATTQEELDKKAEEERRRLARLAASRAGSGTAANVNINVTAPGSGEVRYPVTNYSYGPRNLFRAAGRPGHEGFDMLAPAGTPIFAAHSGTIRVSQESYGGYGVAIVIDGAIGGQSVRTTYGHMIYGSRAVGVGEYVEAGQYIGQVGTTGRSNANHLHLEVRLNGSLVDPKAWLAANAG